MIVSASTSTVVYCALVRNWSFGGAFVAWISAKASAAESDRYGQTRTAPIVAPSALTTVRRDTTSGSASDMCPPVGSDGLTVDQPLRNRNSKVSAEDRRPLEQLAKPPDPERAGSHT